MGDGYEYDGKQGNNSGRNDSKWQQRYCAGTQQSTKATAKARAVTTTMAEGRGASAMFGMVGERVERRK